MNASVHRLRKHADYQRVYKSGRKQHTKHMAYFYALRPRAAEQAHIGGNALLSLSLLPAHSVPQNTPPQNSALQASPLTRAHSESLLQAGSRVGLTVPKALGKAVDRNRIKRRMREAVRRNLPLLSAPVDLVLHPRRIVIEMEFTQLEREVAAVFRSVQAACARSRNLAAEVVRP
jgi:ribonuclease P protein component